MIDFEKALVDPGSIFRSPDDVLNSTELNKEQKIRILHRWEYDARELQVAEEENMQGNAWTDQSDLLAKILLALIALGEDSPGHIAGAPTKQGGE